MNKLRLTTSEPQIMGLAGNPLVVPDDRTEVSIYETEGKRAYLDGNLEYIAGYDIPIFLDGDLAQLDRHLNEQDIEILLPRHNGEILRLPCNCELHGEVYFITLKQ